MSNNGAELSFASPTETYLKNGGYGNHEMDDFRMNRYCPNHLRASGTKRHLRCRTQVTHGSIENAVSHHHSVAVERFCQ